ncbi:glutathione transferase GstA [Cupriavidus metallidurans]|uniref:glutathione transferase GstA n=1 Tax=Cupriavidus metallidurans TaxID=119219 RepID=UPI0016448F00|nr:glutathione transferase GstA [Cupriavidus metallidurans]
MKLYYATGTCSLSPHIILRELGAKFELERVDLTTKQTERGEDFLAISPRGHVAALSLDNGEVLTEGAAIALHLGEGTNLVPPPRTMERRRLHELLIYIAAELHPAFGPLLHPATPDGDAKARAKMFCHLDYVESLLADRRPYLLGNKLSVADFYLFAVARWAGRLDIDLNRWPRLMHFMLRINERPSVQAALAAEMAAGM